MPKYTVLLFADKPDPIHHAQIECRRADVPDTFGLRRDGLLGWCSLSGHHAGPRDIWQALRRIHDPAGEQRHARVPTRSPGDPP